MLTGDLFSSQRGLGELASHEGRLYWTEARAQEKGRIAFMTLEGEIKDLTPATRFRAYGGVGSLIGGKRLLIIHAKNGGLYTYSKKGKEELFVPPKGMTLADPVALDDGVLVLSEKQGDGEALLYVRGGKAETLLEADGFINAPRVHGDKIAWISWKPHQIPWEESELWMGRLLEGKIVDQRKIAGGKEEAILSPLFHPNGTLYYLSDKSGYFALYSERGLELELSADLGTLPWPISRSTLVCIQVDGKEAIACIAAEKAEDRLLLYFPEDRSVRDLALPFSTMRDLNVCGEKLVLFAGSSIMPLSLIEVDPREPSFKVLRTSLDIDPTAPLSKHELISFRSRDGEKSFGFYYAPTKRLIDPPPLIVRCHGGPTSLAPALFNLETQLLCQEGYAVLDVNYAGSSGFGRRYRQRLYGKWGIRDAEDAIDAAEAMVETKRADPKRLALRGSSAGGFMALRALATSSLFQGAAVVAAITDLTGILENDPPFLRPYLPKLIEPFTDAELKRRSPLFHHPKLPFLLMHGTEDRLVLPAQAEALFKATKEISSLILFEGEGHQFKGAAALKLCWETSIAFYAFLFGLRLPEGFAPYIRGEPKRLAERAEETTMARKNAITKKKP